MIGRRIRWEEMNWSLISITFLIGLLGVYNLHSAAVARDPHLYLTQLVWLAGGLVLMGLMLVFDYRVTETLAYLIYTVACLLLVAVLVQGQSAGGAQRWLRLGPLTFQPSELAKLGVVVCLARYFGHRMRDTGYSLRALMRPLNPSRPLAAVALLVVFWSDPWLVDPVGQLARGVRGAWSAPPAISDLLWFRLVLIGLWTVALFVSVLVVFRLEKHQALLNPWPTGRRKRVLLLLGFAFVSLVVGLVFAWNSLWLGDPFGVLLTRLYHAAGPEGRYHTLRPGYALRWVLGLSTLAYTAASGLRLRLIADSPVDVILAPIDLLLVPAVLILIEPDLGTAGIVVLIGLTMILVVGVRLRSLLIMSLLGTLVMAVGWFGILKDYQKRRILTFINPENDIQGAGWNAVQSMIAVGSGRWFGKGHRGGTQTQLSFLPEQETDFAFSVWAEEQGFLGCLLLLTLYLALLLVTLNIARQAREPFGALLAVGIGALILWQTLINVGMVIGMFPVVGLTLPLFSYGGSSTLTILAGLGLLLNIHWRRRSH